MEVRMYSLSYEQVRFFRHSGYIKLFHKLPEHVISTLKEVVKRHFDEKIHPYRLDKQGRIARLFNVIDRDPIFLQTLTSPIILDPLVSLLGENIELVRNRHNSASLNLRGTFSRRFHRDVIHWSRPIITVIVYLEDATVENGCTELIPGSQFLPFVGTTGDGTGGTWMDEHPIYDGLLEQALPVPVDAGGILMFDSLVFHSTGENRTDGSRMCIIMGFHAVDELSENKDASKRILVKGCRIYTGNDISWH